MDKENSVPPGILPKLPEQKPPEPPKSVFSFTGREKVMMGIAGVLLLAVAVWFILFVVQSSQGAKEAVNRYAGQDLPVQEEIVQVSLPGPLQRTAYFYISGDALACALLDRRASGYKVITAAGQLPLSGQGKQGVWKLLGIEKKESFVFGILYDDSLQGVEVDGVPATVVDNGMYRCWFFYGEGDVSINSESVAYV